MVPLYNQFANGWVKEVEGWSISDKVVVVGKVRYSYAPSSYGIIIVKLQLFTGKTLSKMQWNSSQLLDDMWSFWWSYICPLHLHGRSWRSMHSCIAAVLFYLETFAKLNGASTSTQQKCKWIVPAYQKDIPYARISDIDFSSAKQKINRFVAASHQPFNTIKQQWELHIHTT